MLGEPRVVERRAQPYVAIKAMDECTHCPPPLRAGDKWGI